eukprot:gene2081-1262_t
MLGRGTTTCESSVDANKAKQQQKKKILPGWNTLMNPVLARHPPSEQSAQHERAREEKSLLSLTLPLKARRQLKGVVFVVLSLLLSPLLHGASTVCLWWWVSGTLRRHYRLRSHGKRFHVSYVFRQLPHWLTAICLSSNIFPLFSIFHSTPFSLSVFLSFFSTFFLSAKQQQQMVPSSPEMRMLLLVKCAHGAAPVGGIRSLAAPSLVFYLFLFVWLIVFVLPESRRQSCGASLALSSWLAPGCCTPYRKEGTSIGMKETPTGIKVQYRKQAPSYIEAHASSLLGGSLHIHISASEGHLLKKANTYILFDYVGIFRFWDASLFYGAPTVVSAFNFFHNTPCRAVRDLCKSVAISVGC